MQSWAIAIMFFTAFGESFAFFSLLFPGTTLLIAAGTLMKTRRPALSAGDARGRSSAPFSADAVSYWIGRRYGGGMARLWPFSRNPELLPNGIRFFAAPWRQERLHWPLLRPDPGRHTARRRHHANAARPVLGCQYRLGAGLGADAAVRRRCRRPRPAERLIGAADAFVLVFGGLTLFGDRRCGVGGVALRPAQKLTAQAVRYRARLDTAAGFGSARRTAHGLRYRRRHGSPTPRRSR